MSGQHPRYSVEITYKEHDAGGFLHFGVYVSTPSGKSELLAAKPLQTKPTLKDYDYNLAGMIKNAEEKAEREKILFPDRAKKALRMLGDIVKDWEWKVGETFKFEYVPTSSQTASSGQS
jgi:hypothetical protein